MPIASTPTTPISINTLCLLAYKRAGVLPVEATIAGANMTAKLAHGRQLLDLVIDNLAVEGFIARTTSFHELAIVADDGDYLLPDTLLDVFEDAMFIPTDSPDSELVCKQMDLSTWQLLTTKTSTSSRPQMYVAIRSGATVQVKLWPIPSEAGTLRLKVVRLLGNNATGTDSPDLQRYWLDALVWMLAYYVAVDSSMPAERISFLGLQAAAKKKECIRYSFEHTGTQATVGYTTQWTW
jgi:hypothetical protein